MHSHLLCFGDPRYCIKVTGVKCIEQFTTVAMSKGDTYESLKLFPADFVLTL